MEDFISQEEFNAEQLHIKALKEGINNAACDDILATAEKNGLTLEVVWSAFKHKGTIPRLFSFAMSASRIG